MRLAVVGSRTWENRKLFWRHMNAWHRAHPDLHVVSGGAPDGADHLAELWARQKGVSYTVHPAKWTRDDGSTDKGAGFTRNSTIEADSEQILAFWVPGTRGTADTVEKALKSGKPVWVVRPNGEFGPFSR